MIDRKLDLLVATLVMGWTEVKFQEQYHSSEQQLVGVKPGTVPSIYTGHKTKDIVPRYSSDLTAAFYVVEKITKDAYPWPFSGLFNEPTDHEKLATDICVKALQAVGEKVK